MMVWPVSGTSSVCAAAAWSLVCSALTCADFRAALSRNVAVLLPMRSAIMRSMTETRLSRRKSRTLITSPATASEANPRARINRAHEPRNPIQRFIRKKVLCAASCVLRGVQPQDAGLRTQDSLSKDVHPGLLTNPWPDRRQVFLRHHERSRLRPLQRAVGRRRRVNHVFVRQDDHVSAKAVAHDFAAGRERLAEHRIQPLRHDPVVTFLLARDVETALEREKRPCLSVLSLDRPRLADLD